MKDKAVNDFLALILTQWTLYTGVGIFLTLRMLKAIKWLDNKNFYRRLLPILPEVLGIAAVFLGSVPSLVSAPIVHKIFGGMVCAYLSKLGRKLLGQTIIGDDRKIKGKKTVAEIAAEELKEPEQK